MFSALTKQLQPRRPGKNARQAGPECPKGFDDQPLNVVPNFDWPFYNEALKEPPFIPQPVGLPNGGGRTGSYMDRWNCYRNSILVTLMSLPILYDFLEKYHGSAVECAHNCIGCALDNLRTLYWFSLGAQRDGEFGGVTKWLLSRAFKRSNQMKKCLDGLDESLEFADSVRVPDVCGVATGEEIYGWEKLERGIEGLGPLAGRQNAATYLEWMLQSLMAQAEEYGDGDVTPIEAIFHVCLTNRSTQKATHKASITIPFTTSDQILETSVEYALDRIFTENIAGSLPHVLNIHIDRFKTDKDGRTTKNENDIKFSQVLDLTMINASDLYVLQSIILHGGSAEKGHWNNITTGPRPGKWYLIDDEKVVEGGLEALLEEVDKQAYGNVKYVPTILTYVRAGPSQLAESRQEARQGAKRKSPVVASFPSKHGKNG